MAAPMHALHLRQIYAAAAVLVQTIGSRLVQLLDPEPTENEYPFFVGFLDPALPAGLTGAHQTTRLRRFEFPEDAHFTWTATTFTEKNLENPGGRVQSDVMTARIPYVEVSFGDTPDAPSHGNDFIAAPFVAGWGMYPFVLPRPRRFPPASVLYLLYRLGVVVGDDGVGLANLFVTPGPFGVVLVGYKTRGPRRLRDVLVRR